MAEEVSQKVKGLSLEDEKEINILLLGETGAGKSTFINSVFNYLQFEEFTKAEHEHVNVMIPVSFMIEDKNGVEKSVKMGPKNDANETLTAGESATQAVKTYSFTVKTKENKEIMVRLIDTPGMGDTRGVNADEKNCENILSYISRLHHLHAICYLTKSQQSRSTVYFNYCVTQILSRLEKSAGKNIIFVFTHSKGSNYRAGDTLQLLRKMTEEIRQNPAHAEIPLDRNAFCFDNEAFRSLVAIKTGVKLSDKDRQWSIESWNHSTKECWKMIKYILELPPHFVHHTAAINEARRIIHQLSKPMADIAQLVNDNITVLKKRESELDVDKNSLAELKKKLYIPIIDLKVIKLTQPVTVCTDNSCTETYTVGEGKQTNHYKTRCHDPCYLNNVPREIIGSPELMNCACINRVDQLCIKCRHSYRVHMHVYYFTEKQQTQRLDPFVMASINTKELVIDKVKSVINDVKQRKKSLEQELKIIIECNAKFAYFLANNAIAPYSDHYAEYINYLMDKERSLGSNCDLGTLTNLQKLLMEHKEMKRSFAEAASLNKSDAVTPQEISKSMNTLFKLSLNGSKIRELFESQKKSIAQEYAYSEYSHKKVFEQSSSEENTKKKEKKQFDNKKGQSSAANPTTKFQRGRPNQRGNYQQRDRGRSAGPQNRSNHSPPPPYPETSPYPPPLMNYPSADPYLDAAPGRRSYPPPAAPHAPSGKPKENQTINVQVTIPGTAANAGELPPRDAPPRDPYYRRDYPYPEHPDPYYRYPRDYPPPPRDYPPREGYYSSGYDYSQRDGYGYPPREAYPPRDGYPEYPPRGAYPPRDVYPPRDAYPPRVPYPPRDVYPPRDPHYAVPARTPHGPPDPRYPAGGSHSHAQGGGRQGYQKPNTNYPGSNQSRGKQNRGGINRTYRRKNNNGNRESNSGDDSDTSVASSVSKKK